MNHRLKFYLLLFIAFLPVTLSGQLFQFQGKLVTSDRGSGDHFSEVEVDGWRVAIGAYGEGDFLARDAGAVYIFEEAQGTLVEVDKIKPDFPMQDEKFGQALALSGNDLLVGAPYHGIDSGGGYNGLAYFFERDQNNNWNQIGAFSHPTPNVHTWMGEAVDIKGDWAVVGCPSPFTSLFRGSALLYQRNISGNWQEVQQITSPDSAYHFGDAVLLSGNKLFIGSPWEIVPDTAGTPWSRAGAVFVYELNSMGAWTLAQKITSPYPFYEDLFGGDMVMDSNWLAIAANGERGEVSPNNPYPFSGAIYLYTLDTANQFEFRQRIELGNQVGAFDFGQDLAMENGRLLVGMKLANDSLDPTVTSGGVTLFELQNSVWTERQKILDHNPLDWKRFGESVGFWAGHPLVGVQSDRLDENEQNPISEAGSVYLFSEITTTFPSPDEEKFEISAFPNPTFGSLNLDFNGQGTLQVRISNAMGNILYDTPDFHAGNSKMDLSHLPAGLYVLEITSQEGRKTVKKIIKIER